MIQYKINVKHNYFSAFAAYIITSLWWQNLCQGWVTHPVTRLRGCAQEREMQTGLGTLLLGDTGIGQCWAITPFVLSQVCTAIVLIFPAMNGARVRDQIFYKSLILCGSDNPREIAPVNAIDKTWARDYLVLNKVNCTTKTKHPHLIFERYKQMSL